MADIATILIIIVSAFFVILVLWMAYKIGLKSGRSEKEIEWQENLVRLKGDIANHQRVNIKGKVAEVFAPFLRGFPFKPSECKFIGDPIDYLVFEGLNERDIKGIRFVEVKADNSKLSKHQKQIKDLINNLKTDKVNFHEFRFDIEDD